MNSAFTVEILDVEPAESTRLLYAAFDYLPNRRHVERVTVIGDKPY